MDDRVHDLFLVVVQTIRRGELRAPERLMGFVRTVLYRQLNLEISHLVHDRDTKANSNTVSQLSGGGPDPEEQAIWSEKLALMQQVLQTLNPRDAEVMVRSYVREQPVHQIATEMGLSPTQIYLAKSRAKTRLMKLIRRRITRLRS